MGTGGKQGAAEKKGAKRPPFGRIPSMEKTLAAPEVVALIDEFGREAVKMAVDEYFDAVRRGEAGPVTMPDLRIFVTDRVTDALRSPLVRVVNATGIIIHTNLGRSPIDPRLWSAAGSVVCGYSNLEFDLEEGDRGSRDLHVSSLATRLFGCEAAVLTNNNAAGTLLLLAAMAAGKEVVVSRGELVEIGGAFRVPDVIQQGGARLREVGTTNRTRARDYEEACGPDTAALLRVHRSNFEIVGFTEQPSIEQLVAVSRAKGVPLLYDEGSGRAVDLSRYGFDDAPTIRALVEMGVDAVTCSTDKLLGATQGGLILGRASIIERCRRHPLMRALRAGKESYAVVTETLRAFVAGKHEEQVPIYRMLAAPTEALRERAERIIAGAGRGSVAHTECALGGGTTPSQSVPSVAIALEGNAEQLAAELRRSRTPVVGRIREGSLLLDVRTVLPEEDEILVAALRAL